MNVEGKGLFDGATVVLLDDVVTAGHSIAAARRLLMAAGAKAVLAVAPGRAVNVYR